MRRALLLVLVLLAAGCAAPAASNEQAPGGRLEGPRILDDGRVHLDVPIDVYLLGPRAVELEEPLRAKLQPIVADHSIFTMERPVPQGPGEATYLVEGAFATPANAIVPRGVIRLHALLPAEGEAYARLLADTREADGQYNATAAEAWLRDALARADPPLDANRTALVILDAGLDGHGYRYHGDVGWRADVRLFGERWGFLAWDPYAAVDPWVGDIQAHHKPLQGDGVGVVATWIERATQIRALQMPIFPPPLRDCHAVTILLAVRGTSLSSTLLGLQSWQEAVDAERLREHWTSLLGGETVHVDVKIVRLPQEDPALEAATREHGQRIAMATWLDRNYEKYHVPHEGCEPYLSFVMYGDIGDQRTTSNGVANYYGSDGRRISFSVVGELTRFQTEVLGYNDRTDEASNFDRVGEGAHPREWFNWVVSHETGHLFGQAHPNYAQHHDGDLTFDPAFSSTWNVMSYQLRRSVTDFGQVDDTNLARNRAAWAIRAANEAGLGESPEIVAAMSAMREYRWQDALDAARAAIP